MLARFGIRCKSEPHFADVGDADVGDMVPQNNLARWCRQGGLQLLNP